MALCCSVAAKVLLVRQVTKASTWVSQAETGPPGGVEAAAEGLREAATKKEGRGEEIVALFVAMMRAHGLLARTVR
jgi:hypothetical protein